MSSQACLEMCLLSDAKSSQVDSEDEPLHQYRETSAVVGIALPSLIPQMATEKRQGNQPVLCYFLPLFSLHI